MSDNTESQRSADDLVWGTAAIARELGVTLHRAQYLIRIGALPIGRLGPKTLFASKRQLQRHLASKATAA